jgi:hypothetical protein
VPWVKRIVRPPQRATPAAAVVGDMVAAMVSAGALEVDAPHGRAWEALGLASRYRAKNPVVVPMMGADMRLLRASAVRGSPVPFAWDVWEHQWDHWARELTRLRVKVGFVTALESAEALSLRCKRTTVLHLPEATTLRSFGGGGPLASRSIQVLELGRRSERWHDAVRGALEWGSRRHLYQRAPGQVVFPTHAALIAGLEDSAISVCFPSSRTHPERSGRVTTMTHRYLESAAAGCLILGDPVPELTSLLGFDPVIAVDWDDPAGQVEEIVSHLDNWQPVVDRARDALSAVGDWRHRVASLVGAMDSLS